MDLVRYGSRPEDTFPTRQNIEEFLRKPASAYEQLIKSVNDQLAHHGQHGPLTTCWELKRALEIYAGQYAMAQRQTSRRNPITVASKEFNVMGVIRAIKDFQEHGVTCVELLIYDPTMLSPDTRIRMLDFPGRLKSQLIPGDLVLILALEIGTFKPNLWTQVHKIATLPSRTSMQIFRSFSEDYSKSLCTRPASECHAIHPIYLRKLALFLEDFQSDVILLYSQLPLMKRGPSEYRDLVGYVTGSKTQSSNVILSVQSPFPLFFDSLIYMHGFEFSKLPTVSNVDISWDLVNSSRARGSVVADVATTSPPRTSALAIHVWAPSPHYRLATQLPNERFAGNDQLFAFLNVNIVPHRKASREANLEVPEIGRAQCHMRSRLQNGTVMRPVTPHSVLGRKILEVISRGSHTVSRQISAGKHGDDDVPMDV